MSYQGPSKLSKYYLGNRKKNVVKISWPNMWGL